MSIRSRTDEKRVREKSRMQKEMPSHASRADRGLLGREMKGERQRNANVEVCIMILAPCLPSTTPFGRNTFRYRQSSLIDTLASLP